MVHISTAQEPYPPMPSHHVFNSLAFAKTLKTAGVPDIQAEAYAEAMLGVIETDLATKYDIYEVKREIKTLETELKRDIKTLETEMQKLEINLKNDMKEFEEKLSYKLTIRLGAMLVTGISVLAVLMKVL